MATKRRTGGDSYIFIGRQLKYGTPIIGADVFDGAAPASALAKLIRNHFVFTRNTLDPTAEETESESIIGSGATPESIISKRGGGGEWEFELLPDDAIHLLLGWFNPTTLPTNTKVDDQTIPTGKIGAPSGNTVTIDNDDKTALAKWPGQLEISITGATGAGKIRVYGQKRGSRSNEFNTPTTEEIAFGASDTKKTSVNFYHRADRLILDWGAGTAPTDVTLKFLPDTKWAELTLNENSNPFDGWTSQMLKAFTPYIAYNIIPNLFRLSIGANIRLLMGLLASYVQEARSLADPTVVANTLETLRTPTTGILAKYPRKPLNFYPSLGTAVVLGEPDESLADLITRIDGTNAPDPVAVTSVDIEGNHNYVDPEGFTGDPLTGQPVTSETEGRTVTVNAGIYHETDDAADDNETIHWQDIYFEKRKVPIVIRNYNWLANGRQVLVESRFSNCGLTEVPGLPIEGRGSVTRNLAFQANPSIGSSTPDEIEMRFYSKEGYNE